MMEEEGDVEYDEVKDDFESVLQPYDPEEFYDIPTEELPKFIGMVHFKKNKIMDDIFFKNPKMVDGDKPLESHRMFIIDTSEYDGKPNIESK